ncbi:MarR family transcriptional regulator [Halospeciosus flavus]|uniref:MarR family transcriptional regulator n=1 Tax=Halospeciosus flavus TaxID=3032283 RepID=A0ABD5Z165_9EURY|nr:helix-turn-helix domain-containing protein [Halospeciosus flavus]
MEDPDLPPSAKLVLKVLEYEGPLTQQEITEETRLPQRTVRDALDRLLEEGIVTKEPYFRDARQSQYAIADAALPERDQSASQESDWAGR